MLLKFEVENYKSFKNKASLSLVTNSKIRNNPNHEANIDGLSVLKYASVYGGNACGKTNLFSALRTSRGIIVNKALGNISAFKDSDDDTISFSFVFEKDNDVFEYGFSLNSIKSFNSFSIVDEHLNLLDIKNDSSILLFSNKGINNTISNNRDINFKEKLYFDNCKKDPTNLFLKYFVKRENEIDGSVLQRYISKAFSFFFSDLVFVTNNADGFTEINETTIKGISHRISLYDTGVSHLSFKETSDEDIKRIVPNEIINDIRKKFEEAAKQKNRNLTVSLTNGVKVYNFVQDDNGNIIARQIVSEHRGFASPFEFDEESDGTKRIILLCALLFGNAKNKNDKVYIFDEFEKSLHPNAAKAILLDFIDLNADKKSQLIITTHLKDLMDDVFRRDEIFLLDKFPNGESKITPLMEFEGVRTDTKISKNYSIGRFGGIPRIDKEYR